MSLTRSSRIALKQRFSVTLLLFVGVLLVAFPENFARPFIKQFATSLQAPAILIGLAVSIHTLSSGIVSPLGGLWSDKVGKRKPFVVGVILLAGSYVCALYATDIVSLLFARILTGI